MNSKRTRFCSLGVATLLPVLAGAQVPEIPGVFAAGTKIELVKEGFKATEGPVRDEDGGVLFTDNADNQILRIAPDGTVSTWAEKTGGANALARTARGQIVATLVGDKVIARIQPGTEPAVLAREFDGKPFNRPNDIVASRKGNFYFTDTAAVGAVGATLPSAVYRLTSKGELQRLTTEIARPNGVALSPDDRTLYVANTAGEWILAFDLDRAGRAGGKHRDFARLALPPPSAASAPAGGPVAPPAPAGAAAQAGGAAASGADGIAVDARGRLFVATTLGVQVLSSSGQALGTITLPKTPQNLAFAGKDRSTLYVVGRGAVYRIATLTRGPDRAGK